MDNHQTNMGEILEQQEQVNQTKVEAGEPTKIEELKAAIVAVPDSTHVAEPSEVTKVEVNQTMETTSNGITAEKLAPAASESAQVESTGPVTEAPVDSSGSKILTPLIKKQLEFCATILKGLKRHNQSGAFQVPVDPVALGIPDYPTVIKNPMDLSTIQAKMDAVEYETPEHFHADVKLMLNNCYTYNKPDTQVYGMGKSLEKYFDNYYAKLPMTLQSTSPANDDFGGKRRKSESAVSRPRRESAAVPTQRTSIIPAVPAGRGKRSSPEITYCMTTWKELTKKSNSHLAWPFMEPVDPVKLGIPDYPNVIKNPMDLSTIKKKLDAGSYHTGEEFEADIRLMFRNCYVYNGEESDVARIGRELEAVFDRKWAAKPLPGAAGTPSGYAEHDPDQERIEQLQQTIMSLQKELSELVAKRSSVKRAAPSTSKPAAAPKPKAPRVEPTTMTFEEKRQLSMDVNNLSPEKLGRVVEIIHNSMPNLQQQSDSDVIELDIESLDINTLRQLQKYVNECKGVKKVANRKPSTGAARPKKASTGHAQEQTMPAPILEESISSDDSSSSDDE